MVPPRARMLPEPMVCPSLQLRAIAVAVSRGAAPPWDLLTDDFDLVAAGGADNVWIIELGDASRSGAFDAFCASCADAAVDPGWDADGPHPGFGVRYESPAEGIVEWRR